MKKMSIKLVLLAFSMLGLNSLNAQVGIGVASPHSRSILDLTNVNNKGLMLPSFSTSPSSGADTSGLLFYFNEDAALYFRDTLGYNNLNSWKYKYDGGTDEVVYFNPSGYVGVGIGVDDATIKGNLHVALNGKEVLFSSTSAALIIGNSDNAIHMTFDNDEILVKSNSNTAGTLKLQEGGGTVQVGQSRSITSTLNVFGKVQEGGSDLVPQGVIVMWSGALSNIPSGWALCDGRRYQINATTGLNDTLTTGGVQSPDLRERFIVGAASTDNAAVTGTTAYAPGAGGNGNNFVTLNTTQIPPHTHTIDHGHDVSDPGHTHSISAGVHGNEDGSNEYTIANDASGLATQTAYTGLTVDDFSGSSGSTGGSGGVTQSHENRPPYYALAFIIKL